jgi:hypothetical protein
MSTNTADHGRVLATVAPSDIKGGTPSDWLVVGWFTADYRPLAETFAANLAEHGIPFHLYAKAKLDAGWNTLRKPTVVLEAMDAYPGKTLVLMDVDCIVKGDIAPVVDVAGDVGITVIAQNVPGRRDRRWRRGKDAEWRHWIAAECSSRVVVFRPTEGARAFAKAWEWHIENSHVNHDEHSMVWAFLRSAGRTSFSYIDRRYSGREITDILDGIIVHDSAHNKQRTKVRGRIKSALRHLEHRLIRSGRTRAAKQQLQSELG